MYEFVDLDRRADGVAVVRLKRPPANALSTALLKELAETAAELTRDPAGAVVVTGSDKIFAAGADITEFGGEEEARVVGAHFREALDLVAAIPRATIAAVSGYALGGGCELALACDFRVASPAASFGQPEVRLGIVPGGGGTQRLSRLVGVSRAKDMILSGRQVGADEALRIGLVDRVSESPLDTALEWAAQLAAGAVHAQCLAKRAIDAGIDQPIADGLALEQQLFADVFRSEDAAIGVKAFLAKETPTFTGR
jgi:enoyl-CoA hydratase/carnithine racemase